LNKKSNQSINEYHLNRHQPKKPQIAIYNLEEYISKHKEHTTKPHLHSYYQIIWFKEGVGNHYVDFNEYEVTENRIFFIAKNQVHYFDDNIKYKGVLLHFNEEFLVHNENETDFFLKLNLFNNPLKIQYCNVNQSTIDVLDRYIFQIKSEFESIEEFGKEELLRITLKSFLIQVNRIKLQLDQSLDNISFQLDEKRVQLIRFINLIEENYTKGLSISDYSNRLKISSRTLSNLTSNQLNKKPIQLIQERIIVEAKRLLIHSEMNINQVGYRLGFDDPSYFVKYFKKHANISPSEFRNLIS
jgi:AraC-like DNA-binding protein